MAAKGYKRPPAARFWPKVQKPNDPDGCWLWTGARVRGGYGFFHDGERNGVAHRWSYEEKYGPIPDGLLACHKCDVPACVNPDHIFLGTHADNERDKIRKARRRVARSAPLYQRKLAPLDPTRCRLGHPITIDKNGRRRCPECYRLHARNRYRTDPICRQRVLRARAAYCERRRARGRAA